MKALVQFGGFVAVSAALHLVAWAGLPAGGAGGAGAGGETQVSLQGASGDLETLVARWETAPAVQVAADTPALPDADPAPAERASPRPDPRIAALRPATAPRPPAPAEPARLPDRAPRIERASPPELRAPAAAATDRPAPPTRDDAPTRRAHATRAPALPDTPPGTQRAPRRTPVPDAPRLDSATIFDPAPRLPPRAEPRPPRVLAAAPDAPSAEAAPELDTAAPPAPEPKQSARRSLRPQSRPDGLTPTRPAPQAEHRRTTAQQPASRREAAEPPQRAAAAQQTALGSGSGEASGNRAPAQQAGPSQAQRQTLLAQWGGAVRASIERQKRYPRGTRANGRVALALTVTRTGALAGVRLRASSGHAVLDEAALRAVQRARLPAAPAGLRDPRYSFNLTIALSP